MELGLELTEQLNLIKQQFAADLPKRLDVIDNALAFSLATPTNPGALNALVFALHSLGGAAGIFGFDELGAHAQSAEQQAIRWNEDGYTITDLEALQSQTSVWRQTWVCTPSQEPEQKWQKY